MIVEKSFSNCCVKEHLTLAVASMDFSEQPTSPLLNKVLIGTKVTVLVA